jgi:hypothetical protein
MSTKSIDLIVFIFKLEPNHVLLKKKKSGVINLKMLLSNHGLRKYTLPYFDSSM